MAVKVCRCQIFQMNQESSGLCQDLKEEYRSYLYINLRFFKHESLVKYQPGAKNSEVAEYKETKN